MLSLVIRQPSYLYVANTRWGYSKRCANHLWGWGGKDGWLLCSSADAVWWCCILTVAEKRRWKKSRWEKKHDDVETEERDFNNTFKKVGQFTLIRLNFENLKKKYGRKFGWLFQRHISVIIVFWFGHVNWKISQRTTTTFHCHACSTRAIVRSNLHPSNACQEQPKRFPFPQWKSGELHKKEEKKMSEKVRKKSKYMRYHT